MKKDLIIVILAVISILSLSFGFHQKRRADRNEAMARANEKIAIEMTAKADKLSKWAEEQRLIAMANLEEAMRQKKRAEGNLNRKTKAK